MADGWCITRHKEWRQQFRRRNKIHFDIIVNWRWIFFFFSKTLSYTQNNIRNIGKKKYNFYFQMALETNKYSDHHLFMTNNGHHHHQIHGMALNVWISFSKTVFLQILFPLSLSYVCCSAITLIIVGCYHLSVIHDHDGSSNSFFFSFFFHCLLHSFHSDALILSSLL